MTSSEKFAHAVKKIWKEESTKTQFSKEQLLDTLIKSFSLLEEPFKTEFIKASDKSDISDISVISYRTIPSFEARLTFLHTDVSNTKHPSFCFFRPNTSTATTFKTDIKRWELLSRKKEGIPQILKGALLDSIGSMAIFQKQEEESDLFYLPANVAQKTGLSQDKQIELKTDNIDRFKTINGYEECSFACCILMFARALFELRIGTPIENNNIINKDDEKYRELTRGWLKYILSANDQDSSLTEELTSLLNTENKDCSLKTILPLMIINCDEI